MSPRASIAAGLLLGLMLGTLVPGLGPAPARAFDRDAEWERGVAAFDAGDYESAWFRFLGLARLGDPESQYNLAQMYRLGRGIQRDILEAKRWYERAAALGYAPAQYQLGVIWERGDGVPADAVEARSWFARAAQQNFEPAREALESVERSLAGRGRPLRAPPVNAAGDFSTRPDLIAPGVGNSAPPPPGQMTPGQMTPGQMTPGPVPTRRMPVPAPIN